MCRAQRRFDADPDGRLNLPGPRIGRYVVAAAEASQDGRSGGAHDALCDRNARMAAAFDFDYVIFNRQDRLDQALEEIMAIVQAEKVRSTQPDALLVAIRLRLEGTPRPAHLLVPGQWWICLPPDQ
jgi:hypothetical protein